MSHEDKRLPENAALRKRVDELLDEAARVEESAERKRSMLVRLLFTGIIVQFMMLAFVFQQSYDGRRTVVNNARRGCERGKLDRNASARAFRAQSDYLNLVLGAASVKADVKRAAKANQRTQDWAAESLASRSGKNLSCSEAFPSASPWPWDN